MGVKTKTDSLTPRIFKVVSPTIKNISKDSALVLFNQWYLHFSNTFYNYADEKFFSSNKMNII